MDVLSQALQSLAIKSTLSCNGELTAPWGLRFDPDSERAAFFMIIRGSAVLQLDGMAPVALRGGDMILLPRGDGHTISDTTGSATERIQDVVGCCHTPTGDHHATLRYGGGGAMTTVLAGCFEYEQARHNPLLAALPPVIHVKAEDGITDPWLESTIKFMTAEALNQEQGSHLIIQRLSEIIFAQAMRYFMRQIVHCPKSAGWLKALSDPILAQAISLMHQNPEAPWTVATLAESVGVSRSAFAERFTEITNTTPLQYLTDWRMHCAEELMRDRALNLSEIALKVGYQSEAAFSKAFKRERGIAPGSYRAGEKALVAV